MLDAAIRRIEQITRRMPKTAHPGPGPRAADGVDAASRASGAMAALFAERLDGLRAPGDDEPAVIRARRAAEVIEAVRALCAGAAADEIRFADDQVTVPREWKLGITPAAALVADTGSVLLELPDASAAWASLLVDRHVVVAGDDQLVPDVAGLYAAIEARWGPPGGGLPNLVCVSGCSRTADIEKMLVIPAHGPRQVRVVLCDEPVDWASLRTAVQETIAQAIDA